LQTFSLFLTKKQRIAEKKKKKERESLHKYIKFLVFPVLIVIFCVGWFLYLAGEKLESSRKTAIAKSQISQKSQKRKKVDKEREKLVLQA
jgi:hypothetical protein